MTFTNRTAMLRAVMLGASALTMTVAMAAPAAARRVESRSTSWGDRIVAPKSASRPDIRAMSFSAAVAPSSAMRAFIVVSDGAA